MDATKEAEAVILGKPDQEVGKDDYYKDSAFCSFSGLKVFSRCETLYRDLFVTKVYEEPEQDYFTYGKLVDAMCTESPEFISANFVRVDKRVNPEDALRIENQIKQLQADIESKEFKIGEKLGAKRDAATTKYLKLQSTVNDKIMADPEGDYSKELAKVEAARLEIEKVEELADKTLLKGIESCKKSILEYEEKLNVIKTYASRIQVVGSIWENAEETAQALKGHPYFSTLEFNDLTSQQIFTATIDGIPTKGKLDHLKLSPAMTKIYAVWKVNKMTLEEMQTSMRNLNPNDQWAVITDIKTCKDVASLEPYNNHYRGQLGYYQMLVSTVLCIPKANIKLRILAADKLSNKYKKAELFEYGPDVVDDLYETIKQWKVLWHRAMQTNQYVSAKEKHGMAQECFTCTECRFCPLSKKPGDAVLITGPRFGSAGEKTLVPDVSTADAVLEY